MTAPKWYDVTIPRWSISRDDLEQRLKTNKAEKYVIGSETGSLTDYEHYQCRVVFKKPMTLQELKKISDVGHWSPTHVKDFEYCEKEGDFIRSWDGPLRKFKDLKLLPWQGQAVADLLEQSDRQVTVIVDTEGNHGKSWLGKYLEANGMCDYCPVNSGEAKDYVAYCLGYKAKGYVFDIPRADTDKARTQMWKAIEQIKNGCLYDGRYSPNKVWIDPPKILVFANDEPPQWALSKDRWRIYHIERWGDIDALV